MRIKLLIIILFLTSVGQLHSQELGFTTGISKEGIDASHFQPLYGFTLGKKFSRFLGLEAYLIYSQRTVQDRVQADYISFILMPKVGYFIKQGGIYYAPGIALNPTLHHSNIENHTYLSTLQAIGVQINLTPKTFVDLKGGYDIGITKAYLTTGSYEKYNGPVILASIKFDLD